MANYKYLKSGFVLVKVRTKHKYNCFRYYKFKINKIKNSKKIPINKKEYDRMLKNG